MGVSYIVIICVTHFKTPVSLGYTAIVAIADDVLEGVAPAPLATIPADVALHGIGSAKVVPRSHEVDCSN